jgi:hypothetical protein
MGALGAHKKLPLHRMGYTDTKNFVNPIWQVSNVWSNC